MASTLPTHHRALQLQSFEAGHQVKDLPTPKSDLGSAIIRIEAAGVMSFQRDIYNGVRSYTFPIPIVGGVSAIGRIAALGPDSTALKEGQLVFVDCVIHSRDDPDNLFLSAINDGGPESPGRKLMENVWRDGTFAEYAKFPLENCIPLNEAKLCDKLGYSIQDLAYMAPLMIPYGGLRDIKLEAGETIVISPATGGYGGAGVQVAIAMGARVIAMGRNEKELARLKEHVLNGSPNAQIETVKITGDEAKDLAALQVFGTIDAVLDLTPAQAMKSSHLRSATSALRRNGRVSMMGVVEQPVVPWLYLAKNISLRGKFMYEREDLIHFVKTMEAGLFPHGKAFVDTKAFPLTEWEAGFETAMQHAGIGKQVVFIP